MDIGAEYEDSNENIVSVFFGDPANFMDGFNANILADDIF
jgi:hypothetical protein